MTSDYVQRYLAACIDLLELGSKTELIAAFSNNAQHQRIILACSSHSYYIINASCTKSYSAPFYQLLQPQALSRIDGSVPLVLIASLPREDVLMLPIVIIRLRSACLHPSYCTYIAFVLRSFMLLQFNARVAREAGTTSRQSVPSLVVRNAARLGCKH